MVAAVNTKTTQNVQVGKSIWVKFTRIGWHRWPNAPEGRNYLAAKHRHTFHFEVMVPVVDSDREIEFHNLIDWTKGLIQDDTDFGPSSCEHIAEYIGQQVLTHFNVSSCMVTVSEDEECGATVELWRVEFQEGALDADDPNI